MPSGCDPVRACRPDLTSVWPMTGCCLVACTSAKAMRWVKEIFSRRPAAWSAALSRLRRSSSTADRQHPEGGGRGDRQALVHVGDELGGGPFDRAGAGREGARGRGGQAAGRPLRRRRRSRAVAPSGWADVPRPPTVRPPVRPRRSGSAARRRRRSRTAAATPDRRPRGRGETPRTWPGRSRRWPSRTRWDPRSSPSGD